MKTQRGLSGIFFRHKNEATGKMENVVFEDLPESRQDEIMAGRPDEWLRSMIKQLSKTINAIGDQFNLSTLDDDD